VVRVEKAGDGRDGRSLLGWRVDPRGHRGHGGMIITGLGMFYGALCMGLWGCTAFLP